MTGWAAVAPHKAKCTWLAALGHSRPCGDVMMTQGDLGFVFSSNHPGKSVRPPQRAPTPSLPSLKSLMLYTMSCPAFRLCPPCTPVRLSSGSRGPVSCSSGHSLPGALGAPVWTDEGAGAVSTARGSRLTSG